MNSALQFNVSPYAPFMQETKVTLGNGIELHVEVGEILSIQQFCW